jgi:mannosyl-oligosaccharide alpha-1,2-mannosidase
MAVTMVDALTTLWVAGLHTEFDDAQRWLEEHPLPSPGKHGTHSLFEMTIRVVGGLLGAYSLSGRDVFLKNAQRVADHMLPAYDTKTGTPKAAVDIGTGETKWHNWLKNAVLAEVTTVQLELRYLSHATGDDKYKAAADKAMSVVLQAANGRGLVPIYLKKEEAAFSGTKISFGAMGDSYYEYLLKQWLQTGKQEKHLKDLWKQCMKEMIERLVMKTAGGLTFIAEEENSRSRHRMDHLACFVSGMLMLGSRTLPKDETEPYWEVLAAELTRTCYEMYHRTPTGLSPEYVSFSTQSSTNDMTIPQDAPHNLLRPEAAEAMYYMHYYTGDPKYRRWAHEMFTAFLQYSRTKYGFSAIADVRKKPPSLRDSQESFWMAETLKYFYLTFAPRSALNLSDFVLNTEAHPLRMWS